MTRIYPGLALVCLTLALAALAGSVVMVQAAPGLTLAEAFGVVFASGDVLPGLAAAVVALALAAFAVRRVQPLTARLVGGLLWVAALIPVALAAWKIWQVLSVMRMIEEKAGGLAFRIRAPGYAELSLIAATGLLGAGLAFGTLWLMARRRGVIG